LRSSSATKRYMADTPANGVARISAAKGLRSAGFIGLTFLPGQSFLSIPLLTFDTPLFAALCQLLVQR